MSCRREATIRNGTITIKTIPDKNETKSKTVGWLNLVPNKEYNLNVRWVTFLRKGHLEKDRLAIESRKNDIFNYMKFNSLQQAMIKPTIIMEDEIVFDEKEWESQGKIKEATYDEAQKVFQDTNDIESVYKNTLEKENKDFFKGVVIIISNINYIIGGVGGSGSYELTQNNTCFIFREGLEKIAPDGKPNYSSFAHETGHVLGLDHTFERQLEKPDENGKTAHDDYRDHKKKLSVAEQILNENTLELEEYWNNEAKKYKEEENIKKCKNNATTIKGNRENAEQAIKIYQQHIKSYERLNANKYILFEEGQTDNIMDYFKIGISKHSKLTSFFKWQWEIMQKEITDFHS